MHGWRACAERAGPTAALQLTSQEIFSAFDLQLMLSGSQLPQTLLLRVPVTTSRP
jgi:hypothetical protein